MPKLNELHASSDLTMRAVIICDDFSLFVKANTALQRVGWRSDINAQWTIKSWSQNVLSRAGMARKTLVEAADAHMVMIPAQLARSLPFWLRDWLHQWATLRQIPDAVLAVVGDGTHADVPKTMSPELTVLVLKQGLKLIIDGDATVGDTADVVLRVPFEHELPVLLELRRLERAEARDSFRSFGINE